MSILFVFIPKIIYIVFTIGCDVPVMMQSNSVSKPTCRLPDVLTVSHLIGKTVTALRDAGREQEMRDFINDIRRKDLQMDYFSVMSIASRYVTFHE
jgi:hypothetical protein